MVLFCGWWWGVWCCILVRLYCGCVALVMWYMCACGGCNDLLETGFLLYKGQHPCAPGSHPLTHPSPRSLFSQKFSKVDFSPTDFIVSFWLAAKLQKFERQRLYLHYLTGMQAHASGAAGGRLVTQVLSEGGEGGVLPGMLCTSVVWLVWVGGVWCGWLVCGWCICCVVVHIPCVMWVDTLNTPIHICNTPINTPMHTFATCNTPTHTCNTPINTPINTPTHTFATCNTPTHTCNTPTNTPRCTCRIQWGRCSGSFYPRYSTGHLHPRYSTAQLPKCISHKASGASGQ